MSGRDRQKFQERKNRRDGKKKGRESIFTSESSLRKEKNQGPI